jgi:hypothetical protein
VCLCVAMFFLRIGTTAITFSDKYNIGVLVEAGDSTFYEPKGLLLIEIVQSTDWFSRLDNNLI